MGEQSQSTFFGTNRIANLMVLLLFLMAIGIRLVDLTDLPLDFNTTRQMFSAIKARGMYYQYLKDVPDWQRELAIQQWEAKADVEPPVIEILVVGGYLLFGEHIWFGRIVANLFWLIGGLSLFGLSRRLASLDGAIVALAYYLFLYFGVINSNAFQPDPLMVGLILSSLWAFERWHTKKTWKWTIIAGLLSGAAIFVKSVAIFPLLGAYLITILTTRGLKTALKDPQVWSLAIFSVLPATIYTINGLYITKEMDTALGLRFFPQLWSDPAFYVRWKNIIGNTIGFGSFLLSLLGIFLAKPRRDRSLLIGLLGGYLLYGLIFAYHIGTHDYYQLPLFIFVSLSLGLVGKVLFEQLAKINQGSVIVRLAIISIMLFGIGSEMWNVRIRLLRNDFRTEVQFWEELGEKLGHTTPVLGLTQEYGNRLAYWGWQDVVEWPTTGDRSLRELAGRAKPFDEIFADRIVGKQYFIITNFKQFNNQPDLQEKLFNTYPVVEQTSEYIIFDLQNPIE